MSRTALHLVASMLTRRTKSLCNTNIRCEYFTDSPSFRWTLISCFSMQFQWACYLFTLHVSRCEACRALAWSQSCPLFARPYSARTAAVFDRIRQHCRAAQNSAPKKLKSWTLNPFSPQPLLCTPPSIPHHLCIIYTMSGRQGGKAKPLKAPKKQNKDLDEDVSRRSSDALDDVDMRQGELTE